MSAAEDDEFSAKVPDAAMREAIKASCASSSRWNPKTQMIPSGQPRGLFLLFIDWCPKRPVVYFYPTGFQSGRLEGFGSRDSNYFRARTRASDAKPGNR